MKKFILPIMLISGMATFNACGTTSGSTNASNGSLLGQLLNNSSTLTQDDLVGTWKYQSPDCVFESENLLAKAGGEVAAQKIESRLTTHLAKVGIKRGYCSFTFNKDNTYSAVIGGRTINGNYTFDAKHKTIKMTYLAGLGSMTPKVVKHGKSISLLYESDKLMKLVSTVSKLSGSATIKTLDALLGNYDGLYVGMKLQK